MGARPLCGLAYTNEMVGISAVTEQALLFQGLARSGRDDTFFHRLMQDPNLPTSSTGKQEPQCFLIHEIMDPRLLRVYGILHV
jgi:hypothetical protein